MAKARTKAEAEKQVEQLEKELADLKSLLEGDDTAGRLLTESQQLKDELAALRESYDELRAKYKALKESSGGEQAAAVPYESPGYSGEYVAAEAVVLRRPAKLGGHLAAKGTVLATVYYHHPDANLNYIAAAVRNDQATGMPLVIDTGEDE